MEFCAGVIGFKVSPGLYLCNDQLSRTLSRHYSRPGKTWTSAPYPPSPPHRDQHMVIHRNNAPCVCTPCWAYAVRDGIEPSSAALAPPSRHCPAVGLCSLLVMATTYSSCSNKGLFTRLIPIPLSANPLLESWCPVPDTAWQGRPPFAESPQRSPY